MGLTPVRRAGLGRGRSWSATWTSEASAILEGALGLGWSFRIKPILRQRGWHLYSFRPDISHGLPKVDVTLTKAVLCDKRQFPVGKQL